MKPSKPTGLPGDVSMLTYQRGDRLYQILRSKVDPQTETVKYLQVDP